MHYQIHDREFQDFLCQTLGPGNEGTVDRKIFVTPYPGHYGFAGFMITVDGSPPKSEVSLKLFGGLDSITGHWYHRYNRSWRKISKTKMISLLDHMLRLSIIRSWSGKLEDYDPSFRLKLAKECNFDADTKILLKSDTISH